MTYDRTHVRATPSECWLFPYGLNLTIRVREDGETYLAIHIGDDSDSGVTREHPVEPPEIATRWAFWD